MKRSIGKYREELRGNAKSLDVKLICGNPSEESLVEPIGAENLHLALKMTTSPFPEETVLLTVYHAKIMAPRMMYPS
jgi:hypothetical protein